MVKISASLLSVRDNLIHKTKEMNNLGVDYIHIDVMDGLFVSNTAFTKEEALLVQNNTDKLLDVHLMVEDIDKYIDIFKDLNLYAITFHYEAMKDINVIKKIKDLGIKCGISIKPNTKVEEIYDLLPLIDIVLIMSVEPGMGGQQFILDSLYKINKLKNYINNNNLNVLISVDGGINNNSINDCINNGVDILVIGSALTNSDNATELISNVK